MLDVVSPLLQRTRGRAEVTLDWRGGAVRLGRLHQSGSAKAFLPRVHRDVPEVVFLNTAGGLTGGDTLSYALAIGPGAAAVAATQTAERAYASTGDLAHLSVELSVGAGGRLDWLPQETILFDRSALNRRTVVEMAPDARVVLVEMLVLGRAAMGERVSTLHLTDWREVRRGGVPVLIEPLRLSGESLLGQAGLLGPCKALATVALIAPGAEAALDRVRAVLDHSGVQAAASAWDGKLLVRLMAVEAFALKRAVIAVLDTLRGAPLPRVWQV